MAQGLIPASGGAVAEEEEEAADPWTITGAVAALCLLLLATARGIYQVCT